MIKEESRKIIKNMTIEWIKGQILDPKFNDIYEEVKFQASRYNFTDEEIDNLAIDIEKSQRKTEEEKIVILSGLSEKWLYKLGDGRKRDFENSYKEFLIKEEGFDTTTVSTMFNETEEILDKMANLKDSGSILRKGLVVGNVQSGKTANYLALINKAADVGYKLIILMTGVHNILREQTQERVDEGFRGIKQKIGEDDEIVGVGLRGKFNETECFTWIDSDFKIDERSKNNIEHLPHPTIIVIKKNVHTLNRVYEWLNDGDKIHSFPMLLIDDEADNASVDTTKQTIDKDLDPTVINGSIRQILTKFEKRSYVGYTATPFANIFINPDTDRNTYGEDLFPEDCIISIKSPEIYVGPKKVFLSDDTMLEKIDDLSEEKDDGELSLTMSKENRITKMPNSFYRALELWILTIGIRKARCSIEPHEKHNTFLINISHLVKIQEQVKTFTSEHIEMLIETIEENYQESERKLFQNDMMVRLNAYYKELEADGSYTKFVEILEQISLNKEFIKIYLVNSDGDKINYDAKAYKEQGLNCIAIGGYSLSRGFTLKGLTTTYIVRNSANSDTLLQMGRWFGYRKGYQDLCRIFMPEQMIQYYKQISETIEELKKDLSEMALYNISPRNYGPRIREWHGNLKITAGNKSQNSHASSMKFNYSQELIETIHLATSPDVIDNNLNIFDNFIDELSSTNIDISGQHTVWKDIPSSTIIDFLNHFKHYHYQYSVKNQMLSTPKINEWLELNDITLFDVALVSLKNDSNGIQSIGKNNPVNVNIQKRSASVEDKYIQIGGAKSTLLAPESEKIGLDKDNAFMGVLPNELRNYRKLRTKPMLFLHILKIEDFAIEDSNDRNKFPKHLSSIPAYSMAFPNGTDNVAKIYRVNTQLSG